MDDMWSVFSSDSVDVKSINLKLWYEVDRRSAAKNPEIQLCTSIPSVGFATSSAMPGADGRDKPHQ